MSGYSRDVTLSGWQRQTVLAAAALIRERFGNPPADPQARAAHDGLLDVLDPRRRAIRLQREMATAAQKSAMTINAERRAGRDRRRAGDRRCGEVGAPGGIERRRRVRRAHDDRRARR